MQSLVDSNFNKLVSLQDIWDAQPILALVFFLLPTLLICFVCYNMCTMEESDEVTDEFENEELAEEDEDAAEEELSQPTSGRLKED